MNSRLIHFRHLSHTASFAFACLAGRVQHGVGGPGGHEEVQFLLGLKLPFSTRSAWVCRKAYMVLTQQSYFWKLWERWHVASMKSVRVGIVRVIRVIRVIRVVRVMQPVLGGHHECRGRA